MSAVSVVIGFGDGVHREAVGNETKLAVFDAEHLQVGLQHGKGRDFGADEVVDEEGVSLRVRGDDEVEVRKIAQVVAQGVEHVKHLQPNEL